MTCYMYNAKETSKCPKQCKEEVVEKAKKKFLACCLCNILEKICGYNSCIINFTTSLTQLTKNSRKKSSKIYVKVIGNHSFIVGHIKIAAIILIQKLKS